MDTNEQYNQEAAACRKHFVDKMHDYGTAWRILRVSSLTDQIYIKALRIRSLQEGEARGDHRQIDEGEVPEFIGIINYCIMATIQLQNPPQTDDYTLPAEQTLQLYDQSLAEAQALMNKKNHDYGEAWRKMRIESITDIILMKLLRIKQIENHAGKTRVSEGLAANYLDMINYAMFALIKLHEKSNQ